MVRDRESLGSEGFSVAGARWHSTPTHPFRARRRAAPAAAGVAGRAPEKGAETRDADVVAAELLESINAQDGARIFNTFSKPMREAVPLAKVQALIRSFVEAKGKLLSSTRLPGEKDARQGRYRFEAERGAWLVSLQVEARGEVLGLRFTEPPPPAPEVAKSDLVLQLPFRGYWLAVWGGDTVAVNQHADQESQRRAADLVMQGSDGRSHRGEGKRNEDYLAYGQEILAVAGGEVVTVIDGVPENSPGSMNPFFALGNAVIVRHADDLYSVYAHLQPGKLRVKAGAKLKPGAVLGLCGNSGNSSEPHLHFQLQDGPRFEASWGVEAVFHGVAVVRAGQPSEIADYTFLKGDVVGNDVVTK